MFAVYNQFLLASEIFENLILIDGFKKFRYSMRLPIKEKRQGLAAIM